MDNDVTPEKGIPNVMKIYIWHKYFYIPLLLPLLASEWRARAGADADEGASWKCK